MKARHIILGTAGWLGAIVSGFLATRAELHEQSSSLPELSTSVRQWVARARSTVVAVSEVPLYIALDDPVFVVTADDGYVQTGYVSSVDGTRARDPVLSEQAQIFVYDTAVERFPTGYCLEYYTTPMNLDWVVRTMIPEPRQREIVELIRNDWEKHQQVMVDHLQPVLRDGLRRAVKAVEAELPAIIDGHSDEIRRLGDRFEAEILRQDLVPLVRDEIFPVIQEETQPLAMEIGKSLWNRVSLLSFTWRYLYDVSPLPSRHAVRTEFQRFIDQEAVPELQAHTDDFVEVTSEIIKHAMKNERVRTTVRSSIRRVVKDPDVQKIVGEILCEATIENGTLHREVKDYWNRSDTRAAVRFASNRMEITVRTIGEMLFGTRERGITPEFSRVLRSQVLKKDRRWFVMVPRDSAAPDSNTVRIRMPREPMLYPLKFAGERQSPLTPETRGADETLPSSD